MLSSVYNYLSGKGEEKKENEDPQKAMEEALSSEGGKFKDRTNEDGTMKFDDLCKLRAVIIRQANRAFHQRREELNKEKLEAFKTENHEQYLQLFIKGQ